jgi:hypothetical protein
VLAQDTGLGPALSAGEGLLTFHSETEALAGLDSIQADYHRHRDAARAIAERHCESSRVLSRLLERVWSTS